MSVVCHFRRFCNAESQRVLAYFDSAVLLTVREATPRAKSEQNGLALPKEKPGGFVLSGWRQLECCAAKTIVYSKKNDL